MLTQTTISFRDALSILVSIVKQFGADYVPKTDEGGTGCIYVEVHDATDAWGYSTKHVDPFNLVPVCIVGQVFSRLGILRAVLTSEKVQDTACNLGQQMWDNADAMGVTFTEDAQRLLRLAQSRQDSGIGWQEAVEGAVTALQDEKVEAFKNETGLFDTYNLAPLADLPNTDSPF